MTWCSASFSQAQICALRRPRGRRSCQAFDRQVVQLAASSGVRSRVAISSAHLSASRHGASARGCHLRHRPRSVDECRAGR